MKATQTVLAALALGSVGAHTTIKVTSPAPLFGNQNATGMQARNGTQLALPAAPSRCLPQRPG
ncbi:hypothetical protein ACFFLM_23815 [Deinococcus oregonensis]|uniref:Uncharacterized protein n=1 Tax=Deinococcus oregonensis TaxID=1805970 RepID=A0ABV6B5D7_9DEIO